MFIMEVVGCKEEQCPVSATLLEARVQVGGGDVFPATKAILL